MFLVLYFLVLRIFSWYFLVYPEIYRYFLIFQGISILYEKSIQHPEIFRYFLIFSNENVCISYCLTPRKNSSWRNSIKCSSRSRSFLDTVALLRLFNSDQTKWTSIPGNIIRINAKHIQTDGRPFFKNQFILVFFKQPQNPVCCIKIDTIANSLLGW
jgi:hypothetical protein